MSRTFRTIEPYYRHTDTQWLTWQGLGHIKWEPSGRWLRTKKGWDGKSRTPQHTDWVEGKPKGWGDPAHRYSKTLKRRKSKANRSHAKKIIKQQLEEGL